MSLLRVVREFCLHEGRSKTYWIALSGGLDSCVLLSIFNSLRTDLQFELRAIHINHGLSVHAQDWARHCQALCEQMSIPYVERSIVLAIGAGESLEEVAREKRYAIFSEYVGADDCLLTAHHQDDQAETVMLQLLRGSGLKGLASMPSLKPFAAGRHGRPLLAFSRSQLSDYAHAQQLTWVDDESNLRTSFSRNYLRHEVFPHLLARWPTAAASFARSAAHCAEGQALLEEFALDLCQQVQGTQMNTLSVKKLKELSLAKQRLILRTWINQQGWPLPDVKKMKSIQQDVMSAAWDKMPCVEWGDIALRKYRDDLYLVPVDKESNITTGWEWDFKQSLMLSGVGVLHAERVRGRGLSSRVAQCSVQLRQGGEVVGMPMRGHSRTLKNLFQEWKVLPWERNTTPLIYVDNQLAAVAGYFLSDNYTAKGEEWGYELVFERLGQ